MSTKICNISAFFHLCPRDKKGAVSTSPHAVSLLSEIRAVPAPALGFDVFDIDSVGGYAEFIGEYACDMAGESSLGVVRSSAV